MKKAVIIKLNFIFLVAVFIVGFIYYFHRVSEDYFMKSNNILYKLNSLKRNEYKLNYEILYLNFYLYKSTDGLIQTIKYQKQLIRNLEKDTFFKKYYDRSYKDLLQYKKDFKKKEIMVFEYLRYALPINNSILFLANSLPNVYVNKHHTKHLFLELVSKIMLLQRSNDITYFENLNIEKYKKLLVQNNPYNEAFINNLYILKKYYPKKNEYLKKLLHSNTLETIEKMLNEYLEDTNKNVFYFQNILILIVIIISILFFAILVLVYRLEKNLMKITFLAENDQLTGLKNRIKYEKEIDSKKNPSLILFDIDKFKNINDYFGSEIGDEILKSFADELRKFAKIVHYDLEIYRFGGDEFGLVAQNIEPEDAKILANEFIKQIESKVLLKSEEIDISVDVSAGISNSTPYLENSDIALKEAKHDLKGKIAFFKDEYNKQIEDNLKKANEIKQALLKDGIVPYLQGIFDRNKNIYKYEVLCRIKVGNEIKSIFPYLDIVKENKMYHKVTLKILEKSLEYLKKYNLNLSINLSLEDILDNDIKNFIFENFTSEDIARRVTFEILESEIGSYEQIDQFIKLLKEKGVSFAIDDFGSGYSNFERVVRLNVDYIKIDGSIIKNIDNDRVSLSVLKTIVNFAKDNNLKTVAEFIHNEKVFEIARENGVEYFQGFYLQEPKPIEEILKV